MLFIMSLNFTERGIREIKEDLKRAQAAPDGVARHRSLAVVQTKIGRPPS